jgi:diguanylate cyclase (GGDEF)-like protein
MKLVVSILTVILYLGLDAYQNTLNLSISFADAFMFRYEQAHPFINFFISALILCINFIPNPQKDKRYDRDTQDDIYEVTKKVSKIVIAPIPLKKQFEEITAIIKRSLPIQCFFIATYEKDHIIIQNHDTSFETYSIKKNYFAHAEDMRANTLEHLLATFFMEKREFLVADIDDSHVNIASLKTQESTKPFGLIGFYTKLPYDFTAFMQSMSELISFSLYLAYKKEATIKFQEQISPKDDVLNVLTNTTLQTKIEHEFKRHERYHTNLALIIFQIDHIENLSNIFEKADITRLQKEFVKIIQRNIRSTDMFGKWTGEKFAIVSSDIEFRAAKSFTNKIARILSETRFSKVGKVTCSFGITSLAPNDTISSFRTRAENALSTAIQKGGNCIDVKILV